MTMGLVEAARQIGEYGRGDDKTLAHITPDEAALMDNLQGGRRVNPHTGLPEYGMFGKVLKAVARVAATSIGFMYGGPMGAAAANAAATKLTGGSWKQAAIGGATAGLTAGLGNYASGVRGMGNIATTTGNTLAGNALQQASGGYFGQGIGATVAGTAGSAVPTFGQTLANMGTLASAAPGVAASMAAGPALSAFQPKAGGKGPPPGFGTPPMAPYVAQYSDDYKYGVGRHAPPPKPGDPPPTPGLDPLQMSNLSQQYANGYAEGGEVALGAAPQEVMNAAQWGYVNARGGGRINGPGTGTSDDIPAMLSDGEHVLDAATVSDAGALVGRPGDNEAGQNVVEKIKQTIRKHAGRKNPRSPTSKMKSGHRRGLGLAA